MTKGDVNIDHLDYEMSTEMTEDEQRAYEDWLDNIWCEMKAERVESEEEF